MPSASSARVASPCTPETHEHAPAAILVPEVRVADKSEGDLADIDIQSGADPADTMDKGFHSSGARYYESHVRGPNGQTRPLEVYCALGQVPYTVCGGAR